MQLKPRPDRGAAATDRVNFFMRTGAEFTLNSPHQTVSIRPSSAFINSPTDRLPIEEDNGGGETRIGDSQHDESQQQPTVSLAAHIVLETMASVLLCYASLYMPNNENDNLKQYVGAVCVFTVVMAFKDSNHFFPDGRPFVTAMFWAATLYTDRRNRTRWDDIRARITGHLIGWGIVFYLAYANRDNLRHYADLLTNRSGLWVHSVNEGLGTMLECIAITFATITLITPHDDDDDNAASVVDKRRGGGSGTGRAQSGGGGTQLIKSKAEADPPTNDALFLVALSLAAVHYALERIFEATMNPLCTCLQLYVRGETNLWQWLGPVLGQIIGASLAGIYVKLCVPSHETVRKLVRASKRKPHNRA
jgi:hypothetical protein